MNEEKVNCRTFYIQTKVFSEEQMMKDGGPRLIARIIPERHKVFKKIVEASNNLDLKTEWQGNSNAEEDEWEKKLALLNKKLIELGLIIPDETMEESEKLYNKTTD